MPEEIGIPESPKTTPSKFNFQKVLATVGIIFTVWLLVGGGVWYLVKSSEDKATKAEETALTDSNKAAKTANSPAKNATTSATKDETAGWKTYTNKTVGYEVKYPTGWVSSIPSEEKDCGVRFGVTKDQLGYCAAGNGGLLQLGLVTIYVINDTLVNQVNNSKSITGFKQTGTTFGGKAAVKITGTQNDNKEIEYLVDMSGRVLSIGYYQGSQVSSDYSSDFEKIVSTFKFL